MAAGPLHDRLKWPQATIASIRAPVPGNAISVISANRITMFSLGDRLIAAKFCRLKFTAPTVGQHKGKFPVVGIYWRANASKAWGESVTGSLVFFLRPIEGAVLAVRLIVRIYAHMMSKPLVFL